MSAAVDNADDTVVPTPAPTRLLGPLGITIAIIFGLVYAYDLWEAIAPMLDLPVFYSAVGLDPAAVPWWLLIVGVVIVPVVFALALFVGLRRNALEKALIFVVGLTVVACLSLVIIAIETVIRPVLQ
jgi:hypothetical protein